MTIATIWGTDMYYEISMSKTSVSNQQSVCFAAADDDVKLIIIITHTHLSVTPRDCQSTGIMSGEMLCTRDKPSAHLTYNKVNVQYNKRFRDIQSI